MVKAAIITELYSLRVGEEEKEEEEKEVDNIDLGLE